MKNLIILGASGSIGRQTLDIVRLNPEKFKVIGASVGKNINVGKEILKEFNPEIFWLEDQGLIKELEKEYPNTIFLSGTDKLVDLATYKKNMDIEIVSALVGSVGLKPTIEAIKIKRNVLLANKETLVTAGDIVMKLAKENNVKIFPIDSEHSAIYQCLVGEDKKNIKRLIITASGGAFRNIPLSDLEHVTKEDALKHPNWLMGAKITIDCATMMNKGFEVIEAHHLYDVPYDKIDVVIHQESLIHSFVEFKDSSIKAQIGCPDMRIPICYALSYPERIEYDNPLDLIGKNMTFKDVDYNRYPCFKLALECARKGNIFPCVLNASNEIAVKLFLENKIKFNDIYQIVLKEVNNTKEIPNLTIDDILDKDLEIKQKLLKEYGSV